MYIIIIAIIIFLLFRGIIRTAWRAMLNVAAALYATRHAGMTQEEAIGVVKPYLILGVTAILALSFLASALS